MLRPLDPTTTSDSPKFESPVYQNGAWPKALAPALLGHLQVVRGSVSGIPYCDQHRERLSLKIGIDKKLYLCWTSLRMMRRYLAANRKRPTY